jgi:predicted CoA-substrate-specific enzyme activase
VRRLGLDIGSLYLGAVLLEEDRVAASAYREHKGDIAAALRELLSDLALGGYQTAGVTGSLPEPAPGVLDPALAVIEGARFLLPGCRNVFSVGGESFALILYDQSGRYREHSVNPPCASGTGSFIEQQARRLGLSVQELDRRAGEHRGRRPQIATRCAVFAKTDIVHAMQEGYSLEAVCAGLCEGLAATLADSLVKGRELAEPVGIVGGVARNAAIVAALGRALGRQVTAPAHAHLAGAVGAALLGREERPDVEKLLHGVSRRRTTRPPLPANTQPAGQATGVNGGFEFRQDGEVEVMLPAGAVSPVGPEASAAARAGRPLGPLAGFHYLGVDVGSTSTKTVLLDERGQFVGGFYTATAGRPVEAMRLLLASMRKVLGDGTEAGRLAAAATTGSGRAMIRELFRAELAIDEITAHARAAVHLDPGVDTILEIGGQDSKFTRLRDGEVYFSTMNYACAAGTGSFIEEQALRLGVSLERFAAMASGSQAPYTSDRCTVYMERDLGLLLAEGWSSEAVAAAVLHSVRDNYLSKVVGRSPLGEHIVFQGATGRNPALVAAFEQRLGRPIHVSPFCHLTGAMGAALLAREAFPGAHGRESAFLWEGEGIELSQEACGLCANRCLLTVAAVEGRRAGWGMKCGREYGARKKAEETPSAPERRFAEAMRSLLEAQPAVAGGRPAAPATRSGTRIGLPAALYGAALYPLWHLFLSRLGFRVQASHPGRRTLERGRALVNSDFCAPMVAAHGHLEQLAEAGVDYLFFPAVINEHDPDLQGELQFRKKKSDDYFCYYSQYLPTIAAKLTTLELGERLLSPLVFFHRKSLEEVARDIHAELSRAFADLGFEETLEALTEARSRYAEARRRWAALASGTLAARSSAVGSSAAGSSAVESSASSRPGTGPRAERPRVVLLGRPYVVFDPALNLGLPRKLEELGAEVFWQEELELEAFQPSYTGKYLQRMHWHYGKQVLKAAEYCAATPGLYTVFLTCFRCSPDSFLISYVKDICERYGKPFLVLQLDEHASDVGYTTRLEAGLRSFANHLRREAPGQAAAPPRPTRLRDDALEPGDTVLVPYLDRLVSRFYADSFSRAGFPAVVLRADEKALNTGYRYASGGECLPLVSILGGAIDRMREGDLEPARTFFFMPTSCYACNFPQFTVLAELAFRSAGLGGVKIGQINSMAMGERLPQSVAARLFESNIAAGLLYKLRYRIKPYERNAGQTLAVFERAAEQVSATIRAGADLRAALGNAVEEFRAIPRDESAGRRPRVAVLGDLYVKYSEESNQRVLELVESQGGELVLPSMTEYAFCYYYADTRFYGDDPRHYRLLRAIESRYERLAADLIGEQLEPDFAECARLMEAWRVKHFIVGETSINLGRALYYLENGGAEAILHLNPMFCCPGVVTASIYRKMQEDYGVPIVDLFYEGTGNPNRVLIPHLSYLRRK